MNYVFLVGLVCSCTLAAQPAPGTGSIEGHVFNLLTGAPVRKATVELQATQIRLSADTNAEGRFQFTALPAGSFSLSAKHPGFLDRVVRRPMAIGQDGHVTDVEIRLPPLSAVSGRILDEDGDPVGGARVTIFRQVYRDGRKQWDRASANTLASDSGEYRCSGLTRGRYLVEARADRAPVNSRYGGGNDLPDKPQLRYVPAFYPNAAGEQAASPVEVGMGAEVSDIDIHLFQLPLVHVRGKVSGVSPNSRNGVTVNFSAEEGTSTSSGGGSAQAFPPDYTFDISVTPGQYTIRAVQGYANAPEGQATDGVTVSGNVTGLVLTMGPPTDVTGRISMAESGSRLKLQGVGVNLRWLVGAYNVPDVHTDAMGKLAFPQPTPPGHYAIALDARSIPDGCYVKDVKLGGQEVSADDFEIRSSAEIEIILSNKAGTITGSVVDNDGKPIPDSRVTLIPSDPNSGPAAESTDDTGNFRFTALRPGKYKLFAWEEVDDGLWRNPEFRKKYEDRGTDITVGPSETQNVQLHAITMEEMN